MFNQINRKINILSISKVVMELIIISLVSLLISCTTTSNMYLEYKKDNFTVKYQEKDKESTLKIINYLDNNANNIINDINPDFNSIIDIKLFPDIESLNSARKEIGLRSAGIGGGNTVYSSNSIWLVSPQNPGGSINYDSSIVVLHEFTHLVIHSLNSKIFQENILIESICYYEAGQKGSILDAKDHVKWFNEDFLDPKKYDQKTYWNDHYFIGKFIKINFGKEAFRNLIINDFSIEKAFDLTNSTFIDLYVKWLSTQKY